MVKYVLLLLAFCIQQSLCIIGQTSVDTKDKHELYPLVMFGFEKDGIMIETINYFLNSTDTTLLLCEAGNIKDIYSNNMDLSDVVDMLIFKKHNNGIGDNSSEQKCNNLTQTLMQKCIK